MLCLLRLLSLLVFHWTRISTECQSTSSVWTYYPCSLIISSSLQGSQTSINASIDACTDREMTFFWHFPSGDLTLTLESDQNQPYLIRLLKTSFSNRKLIKNIYLLQRNRTLEDELLNINDNEIITVSSDDDHRCSLRFETWNEAIFDYGTFIRLLIITKHNQTSSSLT